VAGFKSWLDEKEGAQSKKADHEEPAFLVDDVSETTENLLETLTVSPVRMSGHRPCAT
jgi:hypothetical protein